MYGNATVIVLFLNLIRFKAFFYKKNILFKAMTISSFGPGNIFLFLRIYTFI